MYFPVHDPWPQSSVRDFNLDGVADELHLSARMPLQSDEVVTGVTLMAFVDIKLSVRSARRRCGRTRVLDSCAERFGTAPAVSDPGSL